MGQPPPAATARTSPLGPATKIRSTAVAATVTWSTSAIRRSSVGRAVVAEAAAGDSQQAS